MLHAVPYNAYDWDRYWYPKYEVNPNFTEDELTEREKKNIRLIYAEEQRRKNLGL